MQQTSTPDGLTSEGCRERQRRLTNALAASGFDAALLADRRNIHALSGHWTREVFRPLLLVRTDGQTVLASSSEPPRTPFVSQSVVCPAAPLGTLVDDQLSIAVEAFKPFLAGLKRVGVDGFADAPAHRESFAGDISNLLRSLGRKKLPDEISLIERGIRGCEAIYAAARESIRPGLSEWSLYVHSLATATQAVGEPIGELGNDFQSGTPGGPPRHRAMEDQELLPLDISVVVRGYYSDLCRTFAVGKCPTMAQRDAHRRVVEALQFVEGSVKPGVSCRKLYEDAARMLRGHRGWDFPHHLGHGIGLNAHETPRLNPAWDDYFQEGDVFTAEPGLYALELRGGVRLEQNYLVTENGIRMLSAFPLDL
jgi:Xaa-Pro dipeptidase